MVGLNIYISLIIVRFKQKLIFVIISILQNWMAFTNLRVDNFTITDSLVFTNTNSPSDQDNYAFCQVRMIIASSLFLI